MLKQERRARALNHFMKMPARVASMAPTAHVLRGSLAVCGPYGEFRLGATS
jgi:hypothetical protein